MPRPPTATCGRTCCAGAGVMAGDGRALRRRTAGRRTVVRDATVRSAGHPASYVISVAAELAGMHPQTLRQYDRLGLVSPGRDAPAGAGATRCGTSRPCARCSGSPRTRASTSPGIKRILALEAQVERLSGRSRRCARSPTRAAACSPPVRRARSSRSTARPPPRRPTTTTDRAAVVLWRPSSPLTPTATSALDGGPHERGRPAPPPSNVRTRAPWSLLECGRPRIRLLERSNLRTPALDARSVRAFGRPGTRICGRPRSHVVAGGHRAPRVGCLTRRRDDRSRHCRPRPP